MSELPEQWVSLRTVLLAGAPMLYLLAAAITSLRQPLRRDWRVARWLGAAAIGLSCAALIGEVILGPARFAGPPLITFVGDVALRLSLRSDAAGALVQVLVSFIGWVILGYSQTYLAGEKNQRRYLRALLLTLAAVSMVLISDNLIVLAFAWLGTSLALHRLLTFYRERRPALIAAHKKFIVSRLGDLCLLAAIVLIADALGTLEIGTVAQRVQLLPSLPPGLQLAAVLLALTAMLKCAQLPTQGWLIQVMEAPTPVSALLHAGVVNLGGFLLFRFAALVTHVTAAQTLLVIAGSITAVIAALVMMTRISIKVMLAWSTCAQMGFMLMECGLGLYDMALLHLLAHSLYKAQAFLGAGGAVEQTRLARLAPPTPPPALAGSLFTAMLGVLLVGLAAQVWHSDFAQTPALWTTLATLGLALPALLAPRTPGFTLGGSVRALPAAFAIALGYIGMHAGFAASLGAPRDLSTPDAFLILWVQACFAALYLLQSLIRARPEGRIARRLYPWFYAGLHLDEWFTGIAFRLWPAPRAGAAVPTATRPEMVGEHR